MSVPPEGGSSSVGDPRGDSQPGTDASEDADVHAFLIADVRGWTSFTQERGDEVAARLAARFAEVVQAVVEDHRGRVVELRGDEALVVFGSPRSAIRAAVALQERFVQETIADPSLPLTVGIGLDAGEAVPVKGGYRGGALNVAARLCSQARAGEVIASREIVHLARRVDGVRFTERGQAQLKGLEQPVHMVAVRSEHQDAAEAIAPFVRSTPPTPSPHRRRRTVIAGAVAFAVLVALVAVPLTRGGGSSEIAPNSIGILDAGSGELKATLELDERPGSIAASANEAWVTNPDSESVTRIDSTEQDVRDPIDVGVNPTGIAVSGNLAWVVASGGPTVWRINTESDSVVGDPIQVGNGPAGIAVGLGAAWVTNRFDGTISRIDLTSGEVVKTIPVGLEPRGIAIGFESVWVALAGSNTVVRIDPSTNEVTHQIPVGNAPGSLAGSADGVWVVNTLDDTVSLINPDTNSVADVVPVGDGPSGIAVVGGAVWVANEADGTLSRIEPGQTPGETSVRKMVIGSVPQGLAGVGADLWVSVRGTATSHRGGTLRLVSDLGPTTLDPGVAWDIPSWRVPHLLGDGLIAFEPIGGATPTLVPDLATSVPTPTEEGRTYRFELRSGLQYSNGEEVAPIDFRRAIERGFLIQPDGAYQYFFGGLEGAEACAKEPLTCDLSAGIETDDATSITFHLVDADPEFLYKLTMPFAYPVPPSVPDEEQVTAGVPGTGPYMLKEPMTNEGLVLVRNDLFRGGSPAQPEGFVERIEWTFGVEPEAQVEAIEAGDADLVFEAGSSGRLEEITLGAPAQIHTSTNAATEYLVLNTDEPPFDEVEVRRALNFAVDRSYVAEEVFDGAALPTCQQLPPNFPGYEPYCPYTMDPGPEGEGSWTAPDMERAQRLVDHSDGARMRVVFEYPSFLGPQGEDLGEYMAALLDELGYRGSAKEVGRSGDEFQIAFGSYQADYPAASIFIVTFHTCEAPYNEAGFCDADIDRAIERAIQTQLNDPAASSALWAAIDRAIVDQAPFLWLDNLITVDFVSEHVGNYQYSPQWGVLLNQLWVL